MLENVTQAYLPKTNFPLRAVDHTKCSRCGRCLTACPTDGLAKDEDGYPVPVGYGGMEQVCINCWNCVAVCPQGAISIEGAYMVDKGRYKTRLTGKMGFPDPLGRLGKASYDEFAADLTSVEQVIYSRRSNRLFKKKEVSKKLLGRIVESARFAPSAGNNQPYKFVVITDSEVIREMEVGATKALRILKNLYLEDSGKRRLWKSALFSTLSLFMVNKLDPRPFTAMSKADRLGDEVYWGAPAVILILKNTRGISNPDLDAGIAAQNMVLTAHSLGLGTCYVGLAIEPMEYPHMKDIREKLGITHPWKPVTSLAVGWPKGKIDGPVKRDAPKVVWIEANGGK